MNERQLESFIMAANQKSFSKAASQSYISTPALVQQINLLEKNIGFQLFERNHQGILLTPAGEMFYKEAKEILRIYHEACQKGQAMERNKQSTLKIAYPFEKFPLFLLKAFQAFQQEHKEITIQFIPLNFQQHIQAIRNHQVDLSIIGQPKDEFMSDLSFISLYKDTYSFCMSPEHQLAHKKYLTKKDLKDATILCGQYNYLKYSFTQQLPNDTHFIQLSHEYDISLCTQLLVSQQIIVIHSLWKENYQHILKVIPSSISAGDVGVLFHKNHIAELDTFIPYLKKAV